MEKTLFTASITLERSVMSEHAGAAGTRLIRGLYGCFFTAAFFLYVWYILSLQRELVLIVCGLVLVGGLIGVLRKYRAYQKLLQEDGGKPRHNKIVFKDRQIHVNNPVSGNTSLLEYDTVRQVYRTKNLVLLESSDERWLAVDLRTLNGGTKQEFLTFLLKRLDHLNLRRIPRRVDMRILKGMLLAVAVLGLILNLGQPDFDYPAGSDKAMTSREGAAVLAELGITGISEELLAQLEAIEEEYDMASWGYNAVPSLLYYAGAGEYDPEDWSWTPAENGVYTFDTEAWDVSLMYTDLLRGISAMSGGALEFTNVTEDNSMVEPDTGTGLKQVSFGFRGEQVTLYADVDYDWMDLGFVNQLAKEISSADDDRRLYFLITDVQTISVFYRDASWAERFTELTGYELTTSLPGF